MKMILSRLMMYEYSNKWTFIVKSIGMIFASSAGLIVSKEEPFAPISCSCGNRFDRSLGRSHHDCQLFMSRLGYTDSKMGYFIGVQNFSEKPRH